MLQLEGKRIILRTTEPEDIGEIIDYYFRNLEHLKPYEPQSHGDFTSIEFWEKKIEERSKHFEARTELRLCIYLKDDPKRLAGMLSFTNIRQDPQYSCFMGYNLDKEYQGKGYMMEGAMLGIKYVFEEYKLHKITAEYADFNVRSGRLLKRMGFRVEGFLRDNLYVNGQWQDHIRVGLIKEDFVLVEKGMV